MSIEQHHIDDDIDRPAIGKARIEDGFYDRERVINKAVDALLADFQRTDISGPRIDHILITLQSADENVEMCNRYFDEGDRSNFGEPEDGERWDGLS